MRVRIRHTPRVVAADPLRALALGGSDRFLNDRRIEIDSNAVERTIRAIALHHKKCAVRWLRGRRRELGGHRVADRDLQLCGVDFTPTSPTSSPRSSTAISAIDELLSWAYPKAKLLKGAA